jgi:hypothetical protein
MAPPVIRARQNPRCGDVTLRNTAGERAIMDDPQVPEPTMTALMTAATPQRSAREQR